MQLCNQIIELTSSHSLHPFQRRAQNEARLRRHKEIEEDKKSAGVTDPGKKKSGAQFNSIKNGPKIAPKMALK